MEGIPAQRSVRTSATPAMMKRVGGGYVLRAPSVEPSQQEQRVTRPPTNEAQPRTSRATVAIQPATRRATTFPTRNRVGTVAVAQSGRAETTETYQTDSSEVTQWKEEKEALAATLANKSEQLRDALEHEGRLNCEVEDLKKNLQTSRNKNAECQKQLDDALMTHLQDEQTIKTATEVHEELKADVARSVARSRQMLEGFETFMEEQGKQLEALQVARNKPTTSSTPPAQSTQVNTDVIVQHGIHAMEKFYKKHRERDQRKLEIALEQNEELKQEVGRSREMLIEFKGFMENQMKEMEAVRRSNGIMKAGTDHFKCGYEFQSGCNKRICRMISFHHRRCTSQRNQSQPSETNCSRFMTSLRHVSSNLRRVQADPDQLERILSLKKLHILEAKRVPVMTSLRH
uniref:AlNc14C46G3707 protein n=1 Tax=Albugo laibachii Nc14 TaxID=890382 RepID=F0WAI2_9STRA|nr:AlNc14C46G3707 [Albugo laibachii Nc14]|eukprot:CCA18153.1 AlNc14C46G3707 [Albugo laibachii Nc14]